ncbi:coiled-coil domain-containing protein 38 isoform X4 [Heterocephalus glaber]|uniref:Coiled-coil domain-containing protein 38 isoform X4 n=1 Tax=Heterocephalus glaber TaxID=10181 RepID=A0AAX6P6Q7_HETGA|nr:coiled-coil domain-containing protein 38 isoform X4 [Heterocephalus glaber]
MTSQVLQASVNFEDNIKDDSTKKDKPYKIFFQDLFLYKQNELAAKKKEKILNRSMKVHQKTTFSSRMKSRSHLSQIAFHSDTDDISFEKLGLDPMLILKLTETADTKRTLHEFISDQRERFLLEYTLSTKRNTIKRLEKHIAVKEMQLKKAEQKLQDNALAFEEFLRENDQQSADAMKIAAQETINKLQMTAELKKASMEVQAMKSEIANKEFLLWEYMKYGFFLLKLSPKHWQIQQALKRSQTSKIHSLLPKLLTRKQLKKPTLNPEARRSPVSNLPASIGSDDSLEFFLDDDMDFALLPELYFKEPEELLQVLTDLEEQNLTLVQYSQDVAENLEEVNKREKVIQDKINSNIEFLLEHKEVLKASCLREEEKAAELELRSRLFSFGEFNSDAQVGRRLIHRSQPPPGNKHKMLLVSDTRTKSQEEDFFFS